AFELVGIRTHAESRRGRNEVPVALADQGPQLRDDDLVGVLTEGAVVPLLPEILSANRDPDLVRAANTSQAGSIAPSGHLEAPPYSRRQPPTVAIGRHGRSVAGATEQEDSQPGARAMRPVTHRCDSRNEPIVAETVQNFIDELAGTSAWRRQAQAVR